MNDVATLTEAEKYYEANGRPYNEYEIAVNLVLLHHDTYKLLDAIEGLASRSVGSGINIIKEKDAIKELLYDIRAKMGPFK